jgi:pimeloyl-ACP methyl ester carboxylesterase
VNLLLPLFRVSFGALHLVWPRRASRWSQNLFCTPRHHKRPAAEALAIQQARKKQIPFEASHITTWHWGPENDNAPRVYLMHGWEGRGSQLHHFMPPLVALGFHVIAIDAPAHGDSRHWKRSTLLQFEAALRSVVDDFGPAQAIIAHSLGAAATLLALGEGCKTERVVFLSPPAHTQRYYQELLTLLGIPQRAHPDYFHWFEKDFELSWEAFDLPRLAKDRSETLLVVHDHQDRDVPFGEGEKLAQAWPGSEFWATEGLGHRRILKDALVSNRVADFIAGTERINHEKPHPSRSDSPAIEHMLFHREMRYFSEHLAITG